MSSYRTNDESAPTTIYALQNIWAAAVHAMLYKLIRQSIIHPPRLDENDGSKRKDSGRDAEEQQQEDDGGRRKLNLHAWGAMAYTPCVHVSLITHAKENHNNPCPCHVSMLHGCMHGMGPTKGTGRYRVLTRGQRPRPIKGPTSLFNDSP